MGHQTSTTDHLIRSTIWSSQIKEAFEDELFAMKYVDMITDFGEGDTINIPSIGQMEALPYDEGQAVRYTALDTGNFTFSITDYLHSGTFITEKMKQDSFYMDRLVASFVPKMQRALMKSIEVDVLAIGPNGQTASDVNAINGARHRWVAGGANEVMELEDFARARYALHKANIPMTNLVAIVDPSVEFTLSTLTGTTNVVNNPQWEGIIRDGMSSGMRFVNNIYGFDIYTSDNLKSGITETIGGVSTTAGVANLFFSAAPDALPFVGSIRQAPRVDSEFNKDLQRDEYVMTMRHGFKLYRPENMIVVLTDNDQVYA